MTDFTTDKDDGHFFVSTFAIWFTATTLPEALAYMKRNNKGRAKANYCAVYYVPRPKAEFYEIDNYAPQGVDAVRIGRFTL